MGSRGCIGFRARIGFRGCSGSRGRIGFRLLGLEGALGSEGV